MMVDYVALKAELLAGHPVTGAYDVDDALAADQLNAVNRTTTVAKLTASELFEAIEDTDWDARTADQREKIKTILGLGDSINIAPGTKARTMMTSALSGATASLANLGALESPAASRAQELGFGVVSAAEVDSARRATI
jgi:hypothetical protein